MIEFEYDENTLRKIEKQLGSMKSDAPKALRNALNTTAQKARRNLAAEAQKTYVVKTGRFTRAMTIKRATTGNLEAIIKATGAPMELKDFKVSPASVRTGSSAPSIVKAKVLSSSSLKGLQKGSLKAFVARYSSGHVAVAQRISKARLPIKSLYSNSIPVMIGNEKRVYKAVEPTIMEDLQSNIERQVWYFLNKA